MYTGKFKKPTMKDPEEMLLFDGMPRQEEDDYDVNIRDLAGSMYDKSKPMDTSGLSLSSS
jgi:hypothetical protein